MKRVQPEEDDCTPVTIQSFGDEQGNGTKELSVCVVCVEWNASALEATLQDLFESLKGRSEFQADKGLSKGHFHAAENRSETVGHYLNTVASHAGIRAFVAHALAATEEKSERERLLECYTHLARIIQQKYADYPKIRLSIEVGSDSDYIANKLRDLLPDSRIIVSTHKKNSSHLAALPDMVLWTLHALRKRADEEVDTPIQKSWQFFRAAQLEGMLSYVRGPQGNCLYSRKSPDVLCAILGHAQGGVS